MIDNDGNFIKPSYPNMAAPFEEVDTLEYGISMGKLIEWEWFKRGQTSTLSDYFNKRDRYHLLRLYARGEQPVDHYQDIISNGDASSYINYDFRPLQIAPKFVNQLANQMTERLFTLKCESINPVTMLAKDKFRNYIDKQMSTKHIMKAAQDVLGVNIAPSDINSVPDTPEELELYMQLNFKPAAEIAYELAMKYALDLNDFAETQSMLIKDVATIGLGAVEHSFCPNKGISLKYRDPAEMVWSFPKYGDFKQVSYYGIVDRVTIGEIQRMSGDTIDPKELEQIGKQVRNWYSYNYQTNQAYDDYSDTRNLYGTHADILKFYFKTTKLVEGVNIDTWMQGSLVLGTNRLLEYGECTNIIRENGLVTETIPPIIMQAPELYQGRTRSLVDRMINYIDNMQTTHIKMQQLIAKARPAGIDIDLSILEEIDLGSGPVGVKELMKIYDDTGNTFSKSYDSDGDPLSGKSSIRENNNGVVRGLGDLLNAFNFYMNQMRDAIGIPMGADASSAHPDLAVGVQKQLAASSNVATRHILTSVLNMTKRTGKAITYRLKTVFDEPRLAEAYKNAIGLTNSEIIEDLDDLSAHDIGLIIELKPDEEERANLNADINLALQSGDIDVTDKIDILAIENMKLASQLLKVRKKKRAQINHQRELEKIEKNNEGQLQIQQSSAQSSAQLEQMKHQNLIQKVNAQSQADRIILKDEIQGKEYLMSIEHQYAMELKGLEVDGQVTKENIKEDRKDQRQDTANSQASQLIDQRQNNKPPTSFKSSNTSVGSGMNLEEFGGV